MFTKPTYEELEKRVQELEQSEFERKKTEELLWRQKKIFSLLVNYSSDILVFIDENGEQKFISPSAEKITGYTVAELRRPFSEIIHPEDLPRVERGFEKLLNNPDAVVTVDYRHKHKDGGYRYFETIGRNFLNNPLVQGIVANVRDVTERMGIEKALRESEEKFKHLVKSSNDVFVIVDENAKEIFVSDSVEDITGFTPAEVMEHSGFEFLHPDDLNHMSKTLSKLLETPGGTIRGEYRHRRKDGGWVYLEAIGTNYLHESSVKGIVLNIRDITERRQTEKRLLESEKKFRQAQKMEAIGTLAGGVAHDLNNILGGLVSYPELLLLQLPEDSPLRKSILTIQKSGEKAAAVVQDLLTLARRGVVVTEVVNLNMIIDEYLQSPEYENLQTYHSEVHIETHLEKDTLNILGSPTHLSKTVMNLVSNAAEAMPEGGTLSVSTKNRYIERPIRGYDNVKEGDYVVLTITDTGIGISPGDTEKIFEPFYTKKKMGRSGTGLGMAVIWGTVKDHNGYIHVRSTEGKGTTFTLYFPVTRNSLEVRSETLLEDCMGKGEAILVVDDVEEQRKMASSMLKALGYSVVSVPSGEAAVEYLRTHKVDLLVLDMIMDPGMDGLDTYKKIIEIHPGQKAIIASGYSETNRVKEVQGLGAGAYIKKPFLLENIGCAVKEELEKYVALSGL